MSKNLHMPLLPRPRMFLTFKNNFDLQMTTPADTTTGHGAQGWYMSMSGPAGSPNILKWLYSYAGGTFPLSDPLVLNDFNWVFNGQTPGTARYGLTAPLCGMYRRYLVRRTTITMKFEPHSSVWDEHPQNLAFFAGYLLDEEGAINPFQLGMSYADFFRSTGRFRIKSLPMVRAGGAFSTRTRTFTNSWNLSRIDPNYLKDPSIWEGQIIKSGGDLADVEIEPPAAPKGYLICGILDDTSNYDPTIGNPVEPQNWGQLQIFVSTTVELYDRQVAPYQ